MEAPSVSIGRGMDKEDGVHIYNYYYAAIKKNEIRPFTATRTDPESVILSTVNQTEKEKYMTSVTWNLKRNNINELYLQSRKRITDLEKQTYGFQGKGIVGTLGKSGIHCHI